MRGDILRVCVAVATAITVSGCYCAHTPERFTFQSDGGLDGSTIDSGLDSSVEPEEDGGALDAGDADRPLDAQPDASDAGSRPWCAEQMRSPSVRVQDYYCIDFDDGPPDAAAWVPDVSGGATLGLTEDEALSAPASLTTSVVRAATFAARSRATLAWIAVGSTPVDSASVSVAINPSRLPSPMPPWSGWIDFLCLDLGGGQACLAYSYQSTREFASSYTGLFVRWQTTAGAALNGECRITGSLVPEIWNEVALSVSDLGTIEVELDGASAVSACTGVFSAPDAEASFTIGPRVFHATESSWTLRYDNVVAEATR